LSARIQARQKLESQFTENKGVQEVCSPLPNVALVLNLLTTTKEFSRLASDANIYKLVGPVLLKQDTTEAKGTVDSRLDYIGGEM
jgi:prefoldin beta subunit